MREKWVGSGVVHMDKVIMYNEVLLYKNILR